MYRKAYVEITNLCNKSCSFCHGHRRAPRQMSRAEFSLVLDRLTGYTEYLYYHLMGEPLTHPLLPEFLHMAGERGYRSIITTNGTLLHRRKEELLNAPLHKVNISLHSFEEDDEAAHSQYVQELTDFAREAAARGVIVVFRLWNQGFDDDKNENAISILRKEIKGEWKETRRGIRICDKIYLEWGERFAWPDEQEAVQGERFFCYGLADQFGVLCDGTVVPCCLDSDGVIALGNLFTEDLGQILTSERARAMVEGFRCGRASEELCRRCGYAQRFVK